MSPNKTRVALVCPWLTCVTSTGDCSLSMWWDIGWLVDWWFTRPAPCSYSYGIFRQPLCLILKGLVSCTQIKPSCWLNEKFSGNLHWNSVVVYGGEILILGWKMDVKVCHVCTAFTPYYTRTVSHGMSIRVATARPTKSSLSGDHIGNF